MAVLINAHVFKPTYEHHWISNDRKELIPASCLCHAQVVCLGAHTKSVNE